MSKKLKLTIAGVLLIAGFFAAANGHPAICGLCSGLASVMSGMV